jgi:hypothetical protein
MLTSDRQHFGTRKMQFGSKFGSKVWFRTISMLRGQRVRPWLAAVYSFGAGLAQGEIPTRRWRSCLKLAGQTDRGGWWGWGEDQSAGDDRLSRSLSRRCSKMLAYVMLGCR